MIKASSKTAPAASKALVSKVLASESQPSESQRSESLLSETHDPRPIRNRLDDERLTELLDIATEVFLAEGFAAASTNEIARRANSSKSTFYSRFPTKELLFLAVLERRMNTIFNQVSQALPDGPPVEETLCNFGSALIRLALTRDQVALARVVSMESARFPELSQRFFELGPKRGKQELTAYVTRQIAKGNLADYDPAQMAEHFISLITGGRVRWSALGFDPAPLSPNELQAHLASAIAVFLRAYR